MGDEAQKKCPGVHLFRVPEHRGKADLTKQVLSVNKFEINLLSYFVLADCDYFCYSGIV